MIARSKRLVIFVVETIIYRLETATTTQLLMLLCVWPNAAAEKGPVPVPKAPATPRWTIEMANNSSRSYLKLQQANQGQIGSLRSM